MEGMKRIGHLLENREDPGFTDYHVGPLDLDNGKEVGSLTGLLQDLSLSKGPLLAEGILKSVVLSLVPVFGNAYQVSRVPAIRGHDYSVDKKASSCLCYTNNAVCKEDKSVVDKTITSLAWSTLHDVLLGTLVGKGNGGYHVGD